MTTPANPSPDYLEWIATHRAQQTPVVYSSAPNVVDNAPGDTTTGYSDTWRMIAGLGNASANLEVRYHFLTAKEMHGLDLTFTNTEGNAQYAVEGSLDAIHYDVLVPITTVGGAGTHRVRRNFDFTSKTYNFYAISVAGAAGDTNSTVSCTDCRLYSFFNPTASLSSDVTIAPGQTANLAFTTEFAESASIDHGVGNVALNTSGNVAVTPTATTIYTLTATSKYGTNTSSVTVTVQNNPPPTAVLTTSTPNIRVGDAATLHYVTANNTTSLITPTVGGLTGHSGDVTVYPSTTTTYTLSAQGPGGETISKITINVSAAVVYGCMDPAATNYNQYATQDTVPTSCTYAPSLPPSEGRGQMRRPVAITVGAQITLSSVTSSFSSPPSVSVSLTSDQKSALGLTGGTTVTELQGLAFHSGAKLQSPTVDVTLYDPSACAARAAVRLDDDGTVTFFLVPGAYTQDGVAVPELYAGGPGQVPYLVPGTWYVWALLVLSTYKW